jgi:hypothetical protein
MYAAMALTAGAYAWPEQHRLLPPWLVCQSYGYRHAQEAPQAENGNLSARIRREGRNYDH